MLPSWEISAGIVLFVTFRHNYPSKSVSEIRSICQNKYQRNYAKVQNEGVIGHNFHNPDDNLEKVKRFLTPKKNKRNARSQRNIRTAKSRKISPKISDMASSKIANFRIPIKTKIMKPK